MEKCLSRLLGSFSIEKIFEKVRVEVEDEELKEFIENVLREGKKEIRVRIMRDEDVGIVSDIIARMLAVAEISGIVLQPKTRWDREAAEEMMRQGWVPSEVKVVLEIAYGDIEVELAAPNEQKAWLAVILPETKKMSREIWQRYQGVKQKISDTLSICVELKSARERVKELEERVKSLEERVKLLEEEKRSLTQVIDQLENELSIYRKCCP